MTEKCEDVTMFGLGDVLMVETDWGQERYVVVRVVDVAAWTRRDPNIGEKIKGSGIMILSNESPLGKKILIAAKGQEFEYEGSGEVFKARILEKVGFVDERGNLMLCPPEESQKGRNLSRN